MALLPVNIDMVIWAQEMRNEYPNEDIPALYDKNDWKQWANYIRLSGSFADANAPMADGFADFRDWAMQFTQSIGA